MSVMQYMYSLQAATSWQAPPATTQIGVYSGMLKKALFCVSLISVVALFFELEVVNGESLPSGNNAQVVPALKELEDRLWDNKLVETESQMLDQLEEADDVFEESPPECTSAESDEGSKVCSPRACKSRVKKLWSAIRRWWRQNVSPAVHTCKEVKRTGGVPSVDKGHSPIDTFGYPFFDTQSSRLFLQPRIPLSVVNGHMQPIKVGASDYVIRGSLGEIVAFLDCFEDYEVLASTVNADGHWVSAPGESNVALQVQNVDTVLYGPVEQGDRLLDLGLAMLTKVADTLRGELKASVAKRLNSIIEMAQSAKDAAQLQDVPDLLGTLTDCKTAEEVLLALWQYVKHIAGGLTLQEKKGWTDGAAVDLKENLTLTITSQPRPCHGVRATLVMPVHRTTLKDIRQTLPGVFSSPGENRKNQ